MILNGGLSPNDEALHCPNESLPLTGVCGILRCVEVEKKKKAPLLWNMFLPLAQEG